MTRVDLFSFYECGEKEEFINLYKFILSEEGNEFEILLPTDAGVALIDYGYSAYAGELLSEIADSFEYFVPLKGKEQTLFFRISVTDKEKLVDVLHFILMGYCGGKNDDKYSESAVQHFEDVISDKKDSVCPRIIIKLQKEMEEEWKKDPLYPQKDEGTK
jgi:hypothetical protein